VSDAASFSESVACHLQQADSLDVFSAHARDLAQN